MPRLTPTNLVSAIVGNPRHIGSVRSAALIQRKVCETRYGPVLERMNKARLQADRIRDWAAVGMGVMALVAGVGASAWLVL